MPMKLTLIFEVIFQIREFSPFQAESLRIAGPESPQCVIRSGPILPFLI